MSAHSHACPKCGARTAPAYPAAYRPVPPRPPEEPERPAWLTAAGWAAAVAGCVLFALFLFRASAAADRRAATEKAEMAREEEHLRKVIAWAEDTLTTTPIPGSAGRPAPTSDAARRIWVISRMLEERWVWTREVMERHGADMYRPPRALGTGHYQANARAYPEVGKYLEGRVSAIAELQKSATAWMEERTAALAVESGMPAGEIRDMFVRDFRGVEWDEARVADAMLELHRHLVRVDPRVRHDAGTNELVYKREDDVRRTNELMAKLHEAVAYSKWARERRLREGLAALYREIE